MYCLKFRRSEALIQIQTRELCTGLLWVLEREIRGVNPYSYNIIYILNLCVNLYRLFIQTPLLVVITLQWPVVSVGCA